MQQKIDTDYDTPYTEGQNNIQVFGLELHNPVFFISSVLIVIFVVAAIMFPESANQQLQGVKSWSIDNFDWLFMASGNLFVLFCLGLIISPFGKIRLGGNTATPDYSILSWFSMLFAGGMGIGLMFWCVAEPIAYYTDWAGTPLNITANTPEAASAAMAATIFHWGLHPWAIYCVVGLSLAFFTYNKGLPLTMRSTFYPILGERCWGVAGHLIDILAVLATLFGLATSLGLGAKQAASGLSFLFGIESTINVQIGIIVAVTFAAILSVMRGLDGGVKILSNLNMAIAALLLLFVFFMGPTLIIIETFGTTLVSYMEYIIPLSNWVGREDEKFLHGWTVFYWAWWVSWSPFVGMFIARISRGRTVREFVIAVLLVPTLVALIWMSSFGGTGLDQAQQGIGSLANGIDDVSLSLFQMLENLPAYQISSFFGIILVLVFFITSSDSGSLVIDSITAGGKLDSPVTQRVFWATLEGGVAAALLYGGGSQALKALQAGAISAGLPFTLVLIVMCVSLYLGLSSERKLDRQRG